MDGPLVYIDQSDIRPDATAELTRACAALVAFVDDREPQLLSYGFHIDPETSTMSVVAIHPAAASLELHLQIGGPEFRKVGQFIDLRRIDVYGDPGPSVVRLLEEKARMLGRDARVEIHDRSAGFDRIRPAARESAR